MSFNKNSNDDETDMINVLKFRVPKFLIKMAFANSVDPEEQSDQGLHCLPFHNLKGSIFLKNTPFHYPRKV